MRPHLPSRLLTVVVLLAACSGSDGDNDSNALGTPCIDGQFCLNGFECVGGYCVPIGQETDGGDGDPGDGDPGDGDPGDGDPGDGDPGDGDPGDGDPGDGDPGDGDPGDGDPGDGDGDSGDGDGDGDGDVCVAEAQCMDKRVALTFVVSYGSFLNGVWGNTTRWEQLVLSLENLPANTQTTLEEDAIVSLIRFGHDPNPNKPGTPVVGDGSGIIDGTAYDLAWSDCNWPDLVNAIDAAGPPMNGATFGMGSWMEGGVELAINKIAAAQPMPANAGREYRVIIITDGRWSSQDGTMVYAPGSDNPTPAVATLYQTYDVPSYVVAFPTDQGQPTNTANALALAGGTNNAFIANTPNALVGALTDAIEAAMGDASCD